MLETEGGVRFGGTSLEGAAQSDMIATVTFTVLADGPAEAQALPEYTALLLSGYYVNVSATDLMALMAMPEVALYGDLSGDGELTSRSLCRWDGEAFRFGKGGDKIEVRVVRWLALPEVEKEEDV